MGGNGEFSYFQHPKGWNGESHEELSSKECHRSCHECHSTYDEHISLWIVFCTLQWLYLIESLRAFEFI